MFRRRRASYRLRGEPAELSVRGLQQGQDAPGPRPSGPRQRVNKILKWMLITMVNADASVLLWGQNKTLLTRDLFPPASV